MNMNVVLRNATATLLAGWAAASAHALTAEQVYAKVSPSVWRVMTYDADNLPLGQGSGVVIGTEMVVTNCHVLAGQTGGGEAREGIAGGQAGDVGRQARPLPAERGRAQGAARVGGRSSKVTVGQNVFAIGNPKGLELTMSAGLVSSLRRNTAGQLVLIQTSAAISGGSSGGGLFDALGNLVGLTTLGSVSGDAQNLNFAIPADGCANCPRGMRLQRLPPLAATRWPPPTVQARPARATAHSGRAPTRRARTAARAGAVSCAPAGHGGRDHGPAKGSACSRFITTPATRA